VSESPKSFLIIQTAFIGDVVLATALIEKLRQNFPAASIDFLLRKGNEELLQNHPYVRNLLVWIKKQDKIENLIRIIRQVRRNKYDYVINLHRFTSSGLITIFSGAKVKIGFDKNPLSFLFTEKVRHEIKPGTHEVDRNQKLIEAITDARAAKPKLYPSLADENSVINLKAVGEYICIAPTSVWFTKQWASEKWVQLLDLLSQKGITVYLLGANSDRIFCDNLISACKNRNVVNLCGKLTLLQSAALMANAKMNYVNDSAPMHLASAMNAPTTAIYCSTTPEFGFGPLADISNVIETKEKLSCRPCGLHGFKTCPEGHFKCANTISIDQLKISY
jgi:heptosyltransferase-2